MRPLISLSVSVEGNVAVAKCKVFISKDNAEQDKAIVRRTLTRILEKLDADQKGRSVDIKTIDAEGNDAEDMK